MLGSLWKAARAVARVAGLLLCFLALVELTRAYTALRSLHPALGGLFLLVLLGGTVWLAVRYFTVVAHRPCILAPPACARPEGPGPVDRPRCARYLVRVMRRLSLNERLGQERREGTARGADALRHAIGRRGGDEDLARAMNAAEADIIRPAIAALDRLADAEVRRCVRDVMIAVTLSPWRSVDLLVVIYRNMGMVLQVVSIYNARPRWREQMLVLRDVLTVVATVNFLNYGSKLSESLLASVPGLGRFTDDVAQGIGAGLLTSVAGHSAMDRCRDFRGWNQAEAQRTMAGALGQFLVDIKGIMLDQIVTRLPLEFMDKMKQGIGAAIDEAARATDFIVRKPVFAVGRGMAYTGNAVTLGLWKGGQLVWHGMAVGGREAGRWIGLTSGAAGGAARRTLAAGARWARAGFDTARDAIRAGAVRGTEKNGQQGKENPSEPKT